MYTGMYANHAQDGQNYWYGRHICILCVRERFHCKHTEDIKNICLALFAQTITLLIDPRHTNINGAPPFKDDQKLKQVLYMPDWVRH